MKLLSTLYKFSVKLNKVFFLMFTNQKVIRYLKCLA